MAIVVLPYGAASLAVEGLHVVGLIKQHLALGRLLGCSLGVAPRDVTSCHFLHHATFRGGVTRVCLNTTTFQRSDWDILRSTNTTIYTACRTPMLLYPNATRNAQTTCQGAPLARPPTQVLHPSAHSLFTVHVWLQTLEPVTLCAICTLCRSPDATSFGNAEPDIFHAT